MEHQLISIEVAAGRLGVPAERVRRWCRLGTIPAVQPGGAKSHYLVAAEWVDALLAQARGEVAG